MRQESDFIPYKTVPLPPGPYLVFAPHPDDETFGMGGTIALAGPKGIEIIVVIITDGSAGGDSEERKAEAQKAADILGIKNLIFWGVKDREIEKSDLFERETPKLIETINPKTVFIPSLLEFHPDHRATTFMVWQSLKRLDYQGQIWLYEITRQAEVNHLIDITSVIDLKKRAIRAYQSQLSQRPYEEIILSLDRARTYTLPEMVKYSEGFWALEKDDNIYSIQAQARHYLEGLQEVRELPLVSVIVRTKDRPELLWEALESVASQTYPRVEAVVVNDAGIDVSHIIKQFSGQIYKIDYVNLSTNLGRSKAGNIGIEKANGDFVCFLDDDDIIYKNHIDVLLNCVINTGTNVAYSDSYCAYYHLDDSFKKRLIKKPLYFSYDFSFDHLLIENYIPLLCLLFKKEILNLVEGFDEIFDLYEDWDLLIRCAKITNFYHVSKVTCEYRQLGQDQFTASVRETDFEKSVYVKLINKHRELIAPETLYNYFVLSGQRKGELFSLQEQFLSWKDNYHLLEKNYNKNLKIIEELRQTLEANLKKIESLSQDNTVLRLNLEEIRSSLGWRLLTNYRHFVEKVAPTDSKRGLYYFWTKRALQIYENEGISGIKSRIKYRLRNRKIFSAGKRSSSSSILLKSAQKPIDIIIPIYNAFSDLKKCISSIIVNTDLKYHHLIIIDDCSTDRKIRQFLDELTSDKENNIHLLLNSENLGFPRTVNRGLEYSNRDVIILNSDTIVTKNWVDRLQRAAYSKPLVATVTPLSNHAYICSIPEPLKYNFLPKNFNIENFADFILKISLFYYPTIPFGSGFCMYVKSDVIQKFGLFDNTLFEKGYGEDTDFCLRASKAGYLNILDDSTFIYHKGGASFESEPDVKKIAEKNKMIQNNLKKLEGKYPDYYKLIEDSVAELSFLRNYIKMRLNESYTYGD